MACQIPVRPVPYKKLRKGTPHHGRHEAWAWPPSEARGRATWSEHHIPHAGRASLKVGGGGKNLRSRYKRGGCPSAGAVIRVSRHNEGADCGNTENN